MIIRDIIKVYEVEEFKSLKISIKTKVKIEGDREKVFLGMALLVTSLAELCDTTNENIFILIDSMIKDIDKRNK